MTMAKKLPLLAPSIHTFEVNGTYTDCEAKHTVFMAIQKMVSAEKYYRVPYHGSSKKGYSYKRKDGGLTITLADYPDFKKRYITLSGVNLARIAGDPSRLILTDLSPEGLAMQEQAFLDELEQLGLLEIEDSVKWKMHRLDITQDFYVKCDPSLMVKIIRYAGSVDPYRKGHALHYNRHNEIRSCKFEKTWYDFALYDKHQQLLNCEKESYPISPDDLERSKNLVRYEIQLKLPSLKEFEHDKLESSKLRFRNHALFHYFDKISDDIPLFLYRYAVDYFGKHSWYNVPTALKAVQMSNLDDDTKELVRAYIEAQDEPELTDKIIHLKECCHLRIAQHIGCFVICHYALFPLNIRACFSIRCFIDNKQCARFFPSFTINQIIQIVGNRCFVSKFRIDLAHIMSHPLTNRFCHTSSSLHHTVNFALST